ILEANIRKSGLGAHLSKVRASGVPVLALEEDPQAAARKVIEQIITAARTDDIQSVVLGCGGMTDIERLAGDSVQIRLIDGVRSAALIASAWQS
ncbi:unnamed protein product, partial [Ectocarpus sp. 12 AP-2014]